MPSYSAYLDPVLATESHKDQEPYSYDVPAKDPYATGGVYDGMYGNASSST